MSEQAVRAAFAAFSHGGADALRALEFCHPDVRMQDFPAFPDAEWRVGHEGATTRAARIWEAFRDVRVEPTDFRAIRSDG